MAGYLLVLAVTVATTVVLTPAVRLLALRRGAVVAPDDRRVHARPTPTLGGLAMYGGFLAGMVTATQVDQFDLVFAGRTEPIGVVLGATIILAVGTLDDVREVSAPAKLAGQVLAGSAASLLGVTMLFFKVPFGDFIVLSPDLAPLVTVLWVIGMVNAVNLIDGLDGLAAGIVAIAAGAFALYADRLFDSGLLPDNSVSPLLAVVVVGMCLGFLPYNFHPAKLFMGDGGAMLLGLLMAASTLLVGGQTAEPFSGQTFFFFAPLFIPFFILGVPILDTAFAVVRRASRRSGITDADIGHLHHRLLRLGHGQRRSVLILWVWTALLSGFVLYPVYTEEGNALVPFGVAALGVALYTVLHPEARRTRAQEAEQLRLDLEAPEDPFPAEKAAPPTGRYATGERGTEPPVAWEGTAGGPAPPPRLERAMAPLSTFTADDAARLAGPDWLRTRRVAAFERFASTPLPTTEEEVWRYSRVDELDLDRYTVGDGRGEPGGIPSAVAPLLRTVGPTSAVIVVRNGVLAHLEMSEAARSAGVVVGPLAHHGSGDELGSVAGDGRDAFELLNLALAPEPVMVDVPVGVALEHPVLVVNWSDVEGGASFPRLLVRAGEDSAAVVHAYQASADVEALVVPVVELEAGRGARLSYVDVQVLGQRAWLLGRQASRVDTDAALSLDMVALGGYYARLSIDSTLAGKGASGEMRAVYFGEGHQMHDFRTVQDHLAPSTTSNLLFKGAVQGRSRAVYTGLIHIGEHASGVDAFQTNRNVKLSEGAWAESVPNLEIENNDVRCSHASAVGPVDEQQRFYLESRGVPPEAAERLVVLGFFEEVLERLPVTGATPALRAEVAAKLARRREPLDG